MLNVIYAECQYAECHYAECRHAECRGANAYTYTLFMLTGKCYLSRHLMQ